MNDEQLIMLGQLNQSVADLTTHVKDLETKVDTIQGQLNKGKGMIAGMILVAGGAGAAVSKLFGGS